MTNSYNGWPGIKSGSDPRLTTIEPVPGRKFRVRAGAVAEVFTWLIRRFHAEVEPITGGVLDDWSYAYRAVRESTTLSNHASGTAVDLNATKHPWQTRATANFTASQIAAIRRILADAVVDGKPVLRWLDRHDPMHFEVNYVDRGGSPDAVRVLADRLKGGTPAPAPAIEPLAPRPIDYMNPDDALVRITQAIVGVKVDGDRGPKTRAATRAHQRKLGIAAPDTLFGPKHALAYLLSVPNLYRAKPDADMSDPAVRLVQWIAATTIDGSFGDGLDGRVRRLQKWAGLYPDGNVGDDTKRRIVR